MLKGRFPEAEGIIRKMGAVNREELPKEIDLATMMKAQHSKHLNIWRFYYDAFILNRLTLIK